MLFFRNQNWLLHQGASQFAAYVTPMRPDRKIMWQLELKYVAAGSPWRRVSVWQRPMFDLSISSFRPNMKSWTEIERINFWNRETDSDEIFSWRESGSIDATYWPKDDANSRESTPFADAMWRVTRRDGAFFTVEISGLADGRDRLFDRLEHMIHVTPEGREERAEPPPDFWKANSVFYIVEKIPFGEVTVRVPRNARDPVTYASVMMRKMIGAPEPEHARVNDLYANASTGDGLKDDLFVNLDYHGVREY